MLCGDILPMISETRQCNIGSDNAEVEEKEANLELLIQAVAEEKNKIESYLEEVRETLATTKNKLDESEKEKKFLTEQLNKKHPSDHTALSRELHVCKERVQECEEEIKDLISERNNTKLLMSHLESLVARHERSLRATVVKRQQQNGGASSEVEVLKALKALFEHHKALDEKVRDKLKASIEREMQLEELYENSNRNNKLLKEQINQMKVHQKSNEDVFKNANLNDYKENEKKEKTEEDGDKSQQSQVELQALRVVKLQESKEKQESELQHVRQRITYQNNKIQELEENLDTARKDLIKSEDANNRLQKENQETSTVRRDLEERNLQIEHRYMSVQHEFNKIQDINDQLQGELVNRDAKINQLKEQNEVFIKRYETAEKKYKQSIRRVEALPEVEAELAQRRAALSQAEEKHGSYAEKVKTLEEQLSVKNEEISRARQHQKLSIDNIQRLTKTVDRLLVESEERLKLNHKEKLSAQNENNHLTNDLENMSKQFEDLQSENDRLKNTIEKLKTESSKSTTRSQSNTTNYPSNSVTLLRSSNRSKYINNYNQSSSSIVGAGSTPDLTRHRRLIGNSSGIMSMNSHGNQHLFSMDSSRQHGGSDNLVTTFDRENVPHYATIRRSSNESNYMRNNQENNHLLSKPTPFMSESKNDRTVFTSSELLSSPRASSPASSILQANKREFYDPESHVEHLNSKLNAINREISELQQQKLATSFGENCVLESDMEQQVGRRTMFQLDSGKLVFPGSDYTEPSTSYMKGFDKFPSTASDLGDQKISSELSYSVDDIINASPSSSTTSSSKQRNDIISQNKSGGSNGSVKKKSTIKHSISKLFQKNKDKSSRGSNQRVHHVEPSSMTTTYDDCSAEYVSGNSSMNLIEQQTISNTMRLKNEATLQRKHRLLEHVRETGKAFSTWDSQTIVAWLELWVGMPSWYVNVCKTNIRSGEIMAGLSDTEIQREIGINNKLHRLKLKLAIQEMISLTSPSAPPTSRTKLAYGEMTHEWIGKEWLFSLGLSQYKAYFMECLVDARMLDHLTKKDFRQHLKIVDGFHKSSMLFGIQCLKQLNYNKKELESRRERCLDQNKDVLVWSNQRVIRWLHSIGLGDYCSRLPTSGIHGAMIALDVSFDSQSLALYMQIPNNKLQARQILEREFNNLVSTGTERKVRLNETRSSAGKQSFLHRTLSGRRKKGERNGGKIGQFKPLTPQVEASPISFTSQGPDPKSTENTER